MFERIRSEFQCLEEYDPNSRVLNDRTRILLFGRIRTELQCVEGNGQNSNVSKNTIRSPVF